jgi:hypothetical protein
VLEKKLQLKTGQTIALVGNTAPVGLARQIKDPAGADSVLVFVVDRVHLREWLGQLQTFAAAGKMIWLAYPKASKLGTDLNRDLIREIANANGLDPVRQIAIDDIWSALRLKSA